MSVGSTSMADGLDRVSRRVVVGGFALAFAGSGVATGKAPDLGEGRFRIILDNDFGGDPDGLYALGHHLLCPSVDIPLIVSSHIHANEGPHGSPSPPIAGVARAKEVQRLTGAFDRPIIAGAETALRSRSSWTPSPATAAILREVTRTDDARPIFYAGGAGLTELALAWLTNPTIGKRLRLVWIGGDEYPGAMALPGGSTPEYNLTIDLLAAQIIFNESDIEIWQVPRDAYRQMLIGDAELDEIARSSKLGLYLRKQVEDFSSMVRMATHSDRMVLGETYVLGDSPLVTLTALESPFQPDPSSSRYTSRPTPILGADGRYQPNPTARAMRVYTAIDTRLTFADMIAKFRALGCRT